MYLDSKLACPECGSTQVRESKWQSRTEKQSNPDTHPYRCVSCSHRFLARARKERVNTTLPVLTGSFVLLGLIGVGLLFSGGPDRDEQETRVEPDAYVQLNAETFAAAEAGDAEAQFRVGRKLLVDAALDGHDGAEALTWLTRAAEKGHTGAMIKLSQVFRTGIGAVQNYALAARWVERAAYAEDPEGMLELGRFWRDGVGFERSPVYAYVWMNRAAAKHNLDAARERENVIRNLSADDLKLAQRLSLEPIPKLVTNDDDMPAARTDAHAAPRVSSSVQDLERKPNP